jgi:hypothetical protein
VPIIAEIETAAPVTANAGVVRPSGPTLSLFPDLDAQAIAHKARAHFGTPREALAYGLTAAWAQVKARRSIQSLSLQVRRQPKTPRELAASIRATRRVGSSFFGQ